MKTLCFGLMLSFAAFSSLGEKLPCESFTAGAWVRLPNADDNWMLRRPYSFCSRGCRQTGYQFVLGSQDGKPEFKFCNTNGVWQGLLYTRKGAQSVMKLDTWMHFAGVCENGKLTLYMDGQPLAETTIKDLPPSVSGELNVNGRQDLPSHREGRLPGEISGAFVQPAAMSANAIAALVARERPTLPAMTAFSLRRMPDLNKPLPCVEEWARLRGRFISPKASNCVARIVKVAGVPRIEVDGRVIDASTMLPGFKLPPSETTKSVREFAAAGINVYSDIFQTFGDTGEWWKGEGDYDFSAIDARVRGLLDGAPDAYVFPRLKLDPPDWWRPLHPDEMIGGQVRPTSTVWRKLFSRMLRDVVTHIENSDYAAHVIGYQFGAMIGGEWLSPLRERPEHEIPLTFEERANGPLESALLAGGIIKEVTHDNKLTGIFYGYDEHYFPEHARLMDILRSDAIDFIASPTCYPHRREGEPGRMNTNFQASYRLHNKVYWDEIDIQTQFAIPRRLAWHSQSMEETVGRMKRAVGWALTSGHEYWWFLLFGNNSFHDETIMSTVKACAELCANRPALPRKAEVALFSPVYIRRQGGTLRADLVQELVNHIVPTCGVPVDSYELADLANPKLPDYKAYLVVGTDEMVPMPAHAGVKTLRVRTGHDRPTVDGLRDFFEQAGAHVWCRSGDVFSAGCGFAMIHAVKSGKKAISLPQEYGHAEWRGEMRRGETRILTLGSRSAY